MIDLANITVTSGNGGRGAGSFIHVKGKRRGKADGGDGGRGGNVYFEASRDLNTLEPYRFNKDFKAEAGISGLSKLKNGANGRDLVLKVPVGTEIRLPVSGSRLSEDGRLANQPAGNTPGVSLDTALHTPGVSKETDQQKTGRQISENRKPKTDNSLIYDLIEDGQRVLVARGGEGGRGNAHLRDEYGRRPLAGEAGDEGELVKLRLELKLIADAGLIGLPNAGKSTLLTALTAARPQIAAYPFTTLEPNLGVMDSRLFMVHRSSGKSQKKFHPNEQLTINYPRIVLADIPGLIEGASKGKGLGHQFLRHIERTKILIHVIDATSSSNKWEEYQKVRGELKAYSAELAKKKELVVLNKGDVVDNDLMEKIRNEFLSHKKKTQVISAKEGTGLEDLVKQILKMLTGIRETGSAEA